MSISEACAVELCWSKYREERVLLEEFSLKFSLLSLLLKLCSEERVNLCLWSLCYSLFYNGLVNEDVCKESISLCEVALEFVVVICWPELE